MKSLAVSEKYGLARYVAHQAYYSLIGRDYEWELMPLALDQKVGAVVWSPLGWGRLTGKIRRGQPLPADQPPPEQDRHRHGTAGRRRVCLSSRRRARRRRQGDRQDGPSDRAQLAAPAAERGQRDHRRAQRRATPPEPGRRRLEPDRRNRSPGWMPPARSRRPIPTGTKKALPNETRSRSDEREGSGPRSAQAVTGRLLQPKRIYDVFVREKCDRRLTS